MTIHQRWRATLREFSVREVTRLFAMTRSHVRARFCEGRAVRSICAAVAAVAAVFVTVAPLRPLGAQSVAVTGVAGISVSPTPAVTIRAVGMGLGRPLRFTLQFAMSAAFNTVVYDSTIVSNDSVVVIQLERLLPSGSDVFVKARVQPLVGATVESLVGGPFAVPAWLSLLSPNSPMGDILDARRPTFVWRSAPIAPSLGAWTYEVDIVTSPGQTEQSATGLNDTTWMAENELQTSASYVWRVRASLNNGTMIVVKSVGSFVIKDQLLPSSTLLYQNFPNPFPSSAAFATCIWFDIAQPGARVSMQVTDLRGNLVRTLIPGPDGQRDFAAGKYGQGTPGTGSSCDNRFVWDGTGDDGRTVAAGIYLLRFQAGRGAPTFRRMLFRGR